MAGYLVLTSKSNDIKTSIACRLQELVVNKILSTISNLFNLQSCSEYLTLIKYLELTELHYETLSY